MWITLLIFFSVKFWEDQIKVVERFNCLCYSVIHSSLKEKQPEIKALGNVLKVDWSRTLCLLTMESVQLEYQKFIHIFIFAFLSTSLLPNIPFVLDSRRILVSTLKEALSAFFSSLQLWIGKEYHSTEFLSVTFYWNGIMLLKKNWKAYKNFWIVEKKGRQKKS